MNKNRLLFLISVIFFPLLLQAQNNDYTSKVNEILQSTDGFELEAEYNRVKKDSLPMYVSNLYEMRLAMLFDQDEKVFNLIDTLIFKYHNKLGSFFVTELIIKKANIFATDGQYAGAADYIRSNLHLVSSHDDSTYLIQREGHYNEMRNVPAPEIIRPHKDCEITYSLYTTSKGREYIVPVVINGKTYSFIYDVCAGNTFVTEKMAKDMGLQIINDDHVYGGSAGTSCKNATIDSIVVGDIVYRHPLIQIEPVIDSKMANFGTLGNPFMKGLGSFTIYPAKHKIVFPYKTKSSHKQHNMMYGRGLYFLQAHSGKERLLFTLDSGSNTSVLLSPYYQKHKEWLDQIGIKDTITFTEAGKRNFQEFIKLKSMPVTVGKTNVSIKNVLVFPNLHFDFFGDQQGIFGTSFFDCFQKVTVNFKDMYVSVKK